MRQPLLMYFCFMFYFVSFRYDNDNITNPGHICNESDINKSTY